MGEGEARTMTEPTELSRKSYMDTAAIYNTRR